MYETVILYSIVQPNICFQNAIQKAALYSNKKNTNRENNFSVGIFSYLSRANRILPTPFFRYLELAQQVFRLLEVHLDQSVVQMFQLVL